MDIFFYVGSWSLVIAGILYIIADKTGFIMGKYVDGELQKQFVVQVYTMDGPHTYKYDGKSDALAFARDAWDVEEVYKVKVWDLRKGPIEPNNPTAPGLIKEYV